MTDVFDCFEDINGAKDSAFVFVLSYLLQSSFSPEGFMRRCADIATRLGKEPKDLSSYPSSELLIPERKGRERVKLLENMIQIKSY